MFEFYMYLLGRILSLEEQSGRVGAEVSVEGEGAGLGVSECVGSWFECGMVNRGQYMARVPEVVCVCCLQGQLARVPWPSTVQLACHYI